MKRNEVVLYTITWMTFDNILRSERSLSKKSFYMIPSIENIQNQKTECRLIVLRM